MIEAPERVCDLVMKGGITSGVVYPLAAVELAKAFRFRNIGGTSVGGIAAAFTAAAEHARGKPNAGFDMLGKLPAWFGRNAPDGKSNLLSLFRPAPRTAPLFNLIVAGLRGRKKRWGRLWNVYKAAVVGFWGPGLIWSIPGLVLMAMAALLSSGLMLWIEIAVGFLILLAGLAFAVISRSFHIMRREVPRNFYGLCSGYAEPDPGKGPPLTSWIADTVDRIAGRDPATNPPLTFGDLWKGGRDDPDGVNLQMMTTNLTQGRPMRVPFEDPGQKGYGQYYFEPEEMRQFFPPRIVEWLIQHSPRSTRTGLAFGTLLPLPLAQDLPVAFGVRLSLSYPILLSAVPLYAIDWTRTGSRAALKPERCWFSDGGLSSNFPVHLFDQPLPRWPTFAINLRPPHPDMPDDVVWMPRDNREKGVALWNRFEPDGRPSMMGFLRAVRDTTQSWMDNELARVPGYRDRIVHVTLKRGEGGWNLNMPGEVIADIGERGRSAGRLLAERYATGPQWDVESNWDNHRWVRYRSTMHVTEEMLRSVERGLRYRPPGLRYFEELAARPNGAPPLAFPWWNDGQRAHALQATEVLKALVESWQSADQTFGKAHRDDPGPPEPTPELRIMPRI